MSLSWLMAAVVSLCSLLWVASFTSAAARSVLSKLRLFASGFATMALSPDKRWSKPKVDPDAIKGAKHAETKRIVFIRHGESDWNEVFNRGFGPSFFVRLIKAIIREVLLSVTDDSIFIDSSLSPLGAQQARELIDFLETPTTSVENTEMHALLRGDNGASGSVIMASNLRRAIATAAIGLQRRLKLTGEKILIVSTLQEISFNLDASALAPPKQVPDLHSIRADMWSSYSPDVLFDPSLNSGDKPLFGNGLQRMMGFCEIAFSREESTVIAVGHSLYFRSFFKTFLPSASDHIAKKKKMVNSGTVAFDLTKATYEGKTVYRIDPDSVSVVYGGFAK